MVLRQCRGRRRRLLAKKNRTAALPAILEEDPPPCQAGMPCAETAQAALYVGPKGQVLHTRHLNKLLNGRGRRGVTEDAGSSTCPTLRSMTQGPITA